MFKIGLSTPSCAEINEELFQQYKEAGISYMEISLAGELANNINFETARVLADKYGIVLWSFHLPFWPFSEIDISKPEIAERTLEYLKGFIDKASAVGIDKFVIHASGEPIKDEERPLRMETAKKSLAILADYAGERGAKIIVENLPRTCLGRNSSDIKELLSAHDALLSCFDTNHLLCQDFCEYLDDVGDKIVTLHVSDYDFKDERHWLPYEGKIDWQKMLAKLKEINYSGIWLYEIELNAPWTIERERALNMSDFVNNANSLFAGEAPSFLGKPKENL